MAAATTCFDPITKTGTSQENGGPEADSYYPNVPTDSGAAFFRFERELVRDVWVLGDLVNLYAQLDAGSTQSPH